MNLGSVDRLLRIVIGALLAISPFVPALAAKLPVTPWNWVIMVIGLVLLATGLFRFCPAYRLLGINTCSRT